MCDVCSAVINTACAPVRAKYNVCVLDEITSSEPYTQRTSNLYCVKDIKTVFFFFFLFFIYAHTSSLSLNIASNAIYRERISQVAHDTQQKACSYTHAKYTYRSRSMSDEHKLICSVVCILVSVKTHWNQTHHTHTLIHDTCLCASAYVCVCTFINESGLFFLCRWWRRHRR